MYASAKGETEIEKKSGNDVDAPPVCRTPTSSCGAHPEDRGAARAEEHDVARCGVNEEGCGVPTSAKRGCGNKGDRMTVRQ